MIKQNLKNLFMPFLIVSILVNIFICFYVGKLKIENNRLKIFTKEKKEQYELLAIKKEKIEFITTVLEKKYNLHKEEAEIYAYLLNQREEILGISWLWFAAQIQCESNWHSLVVAKPTKLKGDKKKESAIGIMQVKFSTAKEMEEKKGYLINSPDELKDPIKCIMHGSAYYYFRLKKWNNNIEKAIMAFNSGDSGCKRGQGANHWEKVKKEYFDLMSTIFFINSTKNGSFIEKFSIRDLKELIILAEK